MISGSTALTAFDDGGLLLLLRSVSSTVMLCIADCKSDISGVGNSSGVIAGDDTISSAASISGGIVELVLAMGSDGIGSDLIDLKLLLWTLMGL